MNGQNLSGQTLGQYELKELIGRGGMGAVYRGYQPALDRSVAIKVMSLSVVNEPGYAERFNREAKIVASLEHPQIVPLYDYGISGDVSYVVMRLLTGGSLEDRMRRGERLSLTEIATLLRQITAALEYAHSRGLIHRDIKPSNVMFDGRGDAYLVDFGIAKLLQSSQVLTTHTALLGTPSYMAPEQWMDQDLTPAADQYALGILTYQLLTGELPFEATTPYALMNKHINQAPPSPQVLRPDVPENVAAVVQRAIAKAPADRFPTVTAYATVFETATKDREADLKTTPISLPISARTKPAPTAAVTDQLPQTRSQRRPPSRGLITGVAVLALIGVIVVLLQSIGQPPAAPVTPTEIAALLVTEEATAERTAEALAAEVTATVEPTAAEMPLTRTPRPTFTPVPPSRTPRPTHTATDTTETNLTPTLTGYQNFTQGMQAFDSGDNETAITYFTQTLALDPGYVDAYYFRGVAHYYTAQLDAALSDYNQTLALKPDYLDVYANRAQVQYELGDYPAALTDIDAALAIYEENPGAHYLRAQIQLQLDDPQAALVDFTRVLELDLTWTGVYYERGWVYFGVQEYEAALSDFEAILATDPQNIEILHATAEAQDALEDKEDALETFEDALDIDEYDSYAVRRSADLFYDLERWDEARDYYEWYIELVGDATESYVRERLTTIEDMSARGSEETGK